MTPHESKWKLGSKGGRTIHVVASETGDDMIGTMDSNDLAQHVVEAHNLLLERTDIGEITSSLEDTTLALKACTERLAIADRFVDWLLAMDDPLDAEGRARRQRVNLGWIFQEAKIVRDTRGEEQILG